jgi:hypothetical protein
MLWVGARTGVYARVDAVAELGAALGATAIMLRSIDRRGWSDVGLARDQARPRQILDGFAIGFGAIALTCGALVALHLLRFVPSDAGGGWGGGALRVTIVLLPAALAEEIICRGYLLTVIRDSVGTWAAVLLTSVMFGLLHLANPGATPESVAVVTLSGLMLGGIRVATGSLYAAWAAHFAWNWVMAVLVHASVSGLRFEAPGYRAEAVGPVWLSGGSWGPEGGLVAALGMISGLAYLYARRRREES